MTRRILRSVAAIGAALAIATLGLATPASADPTINPDQTGSLTITKQSGAPKDQTQCEPNGKELPAECVTSPLAGAGYTVYRVNMPGTTTPVDLTTNAGWQQASAYYNNIALAADNTQTPGTESGLTGADGRTSVGNLPVGLYYVVETTVPDGYTAAAPFLVTIPMTDPENRTDWIYDVNVYPKNTRDTIEKEVLDGNRGTGNQDAPKVGDNLTYRLTSTISNLGDHNGDGTVNGLDIGKYVIGDNLNEHVTAVSVEASIIGDNTDPAVPLVAGTDYTLTIDTATPGQPVVLTFTRAGLDKLMAAKLADDTAQVQTDIVAKVTTIPPEGTIPNQAYLIPNQPWEDQNPGKPGIPSDVVYSKYGEIVIHKTAGDDATTPRTAPSSRCTWEPCVRARPLRPPSRPAAPWVARWAPSRSPTTTANCRVCSCRTSSTCRRFRPGSPSRHRSPTTRTSTGTAWWKPRLRTDTSCRLSRFRSASPPRVSST
ncbi:SpaH/EbpB family LPXTG-anchored major pilin [Enemella sp. A6]|uniref:SpaH/EbpB family LPXTG-anchored major pilin n=1 Tax=Enemella sp. A6 TaxID=3440152 RepID=UPI003EB7BCD1